MIKIFEEGFSEKEFNDFISKNIIDKFVLNPTGRSYLYYSPIKQFGLEPIGQVEKIHIMADVLDDRILVARIDKIEEEAKLKEIEAKIEKTNPNSKEQWDTLQRNRIETENHVKMLEDTLRTNIGQKTILEQEYKELLKDL